MKQKNNAVKSRNPLSILYIVIFYAIAAILFDPRVTIAVVAVIILTAAAAGEGFSFLKLWLKSIVMICLVCFILQSLFIPGEDILIKVWIFKVTQEGIDKAVVLCSRILGVGSAILLAGKLINIKNLMSVLEKRGVSPSVTYILLSTSNIIPQMSKKMNAIMDAQKSRGIETDSNIIVRAKAFFPAVGPLLLNSIVNAEERAITLEARAFSAPCSKTKLEEIPDSRLDKMIRGLMVLAVILMIGGKIVLWIVLK